MERRAEKILTIDDNQDNLIILKALIHEAFPEAVVLTARNGQTGLKIASEVEPDVILLDIIMPGMDGYEVCRKLKADKELCDIPVVFLTAISSNKASRMKALECGAEAFLTKPIDESELTAQIRVMLKIRNSIIEKRNESGRLASLVEEKTHQLEKVFENLWLENDARKKSQSALAESEAKYRQITENISDVVWTTDMDLKTIYISPSVEKMLGESPEANMKKTFEEKFAPDSLRIIHEAFFEELEKEKDSNCDKNRTLILEVEQNRVDGSVIWVSMHVSFLRDKDGKVIGYQGVSRDITERKHIEEQLKQNLNELVFLSYHDHLTGLYNRRFFEKNLKELDIIANLPLSIIICDINGLKLINDSFGHDDGDQLLVKAARAIQEACEAEGIISRIGGDEFAVLLPKTDAESASQIAGNIKKFAQREVVENIELSISYGYDTKTSITQDIIEVMANAENHMYRHKLYERSSARSKTIDIIMNTLFEKSDRESMHSSRVGSICMAIATEMAFDKGDVNKMGIAGLVHDIGKIGIDENILNKNGRLTTDEREQIERHPEIGWRILSSATEFSELALFILDHHEKWDGSGYPNGLKGEEIPLEARIIAVADAYDAMTSDRSYRQGMSEDEAIKELQRCSGKQFDPGIIDVCVNKAILYNIFS